MDQLKLWKFVFGYENLTNTYKVAALHRGSNRTTEARVLSFGINIWRNIQSFPGAETLTQFPPLQDLPNVPDSLNASCVLPGVCALMNSLCFYHEFGGTGFVIWKMTEYGDEKS
ncbi:hypothetical protein MTR_0064s0070 [Medicago truncatula]|uniref:Uncharacterized protein n=1 Tax=Medicago truncatula TaxID=3880 RepID=A0A072TIA8_MEDTR|nr:hypothetical protein MTR_0064s0070 [Medicago truncatula]